MKLLKLSFIISITGIFALLLLSQNQKYKEISSYNELKIGDFVQLSGKIISIKNSNNFKTMKLSTNISVTCNKCNFQENETILVQGKVIKYKNNLYISADKITLK